MYTGLSDDYNHNICNFRYEHIVSSQKRKEVTRAKKCDWTVIEFSIFWRYFSRDWLQKVEILNYFKFLNLGWLEVEIFMIDSTSMLVIEAILHVVTLYLL